VHYFVTTLYHPIHLAEQMETENETIAALLHDVVEDTDVTPADLDREGIPKAAVEAVLLLTHPEGMDYFAYLEGVVTNPVALKVKLADLEHNSDETRLESLDEQTATRLREKYAKAKSFLAEKVR
jgi:(p)ppGpp synthase/HD superfamily hydrolase